MSENFVTRERNGVYLKARMYTMQSIQSYCTIGGAFYCTMRGRVFYSTMRGGGGLMYDEGGGGVIVR